MSNLYSITLNGTGYDIGSSGSGYTVEDKAISPSYFGHDYDNNQFGTYINQPMSKYPCATFTDSNITLIVKNVISIIIGCRVELFGTDYNCSNRGTVLVGNDTYTIYRADINADTELTPATASDRTWKLVCPIRGNGVMVSSNDDVVIVADMELEDINEDFINNNYRYLTVSDDFVSAVEYATSPAVHPNAQLNGKIWLAIGDSYTYQLYGYDGTIAANTSQFGKMAEDLGMTCYSHGVNSSTIRTSSDNWGQDQAAHQPMVTRVDSIVTTHSDHASDVALITFMGGLNDPETESKVGTFLSTGKDTTCGGCHYIFKTLLENFPNAKIIVILQPSCYNFTNPGTGDTAGFDDDYQYGNYQCGKKQRYIKEIAEMYGLDICDCIFNWYTPQNPVHRSTYWSSDKIHLNTTGFRRLAEKLALKINEIFG